MTTPNPMPLALTDRMLGVLAEIASGQSNAEIAKTFGLTLNTVKTHVQRIMRFLGARDRAHAVAIALRTGLICADCTQPSEPRPTVAGLAEAA
ncbi:helix-turn-helix domain-containing protein [Streptacidiphilus griseoplanus]|uniref:helix-turn-helix domain-containing protein n=1 Tax=Peterkaempfera griseoplana TaxID=66896 RepID=UPI0006E21549|nr:LuxR C-terminal-related transcriptional regulator [Peterkaempfera griseoplana]